MNLVYSDLTVIATLIVVFCLFAQWKGKNTLTSIVIAFYPAALIYINVPYLSSLVLFNQSPFWVSFSHFLVLVAIAIVIRIVLRRVLVPRAYSSSTNFLSILLLAVAFTGFLIALSLHLPGIQHLLPLSNQVNYLFQAPFSYGIWLLLPILAA